MDTTQFVNAIRESVLEEYTEYYRTTLNERSAHSVNDLYWKELIGLYQTLDERQRRIIHALVRQVSADTISSLFGIIDGSSTLVPKSGWSFQLISQPDGVRLDGDLQDIFLSQMECVIIGDGNCLDFTH